MIVEEYGIKVIVYYDNGQAELSAILNAVLFNEVEFRKAEPQKSFKMDSEVNYLDGE